MSVPPFYLDGLLIHGRGFGFDLDTGKPRLSSRISEMAAITVRRWLVADAAAGIGHVIHKLDGTPYARSPSNIWHAVMEDAGLGSDVVPHTLRHTAATMLRIANVDVRKGPTSSAWPFRLWSGFTASGRCRARKRQPRPWRTSGA